MSFTATTRDVMQAIGVLDPKTLHRRREDYNDKSIHPSKQFFKLGVHYLRKSPNSKTVMWDQAATVRAWTEATKISALSNAADAVIAMARGGEVSNDD